MRLANIYIEHPTLSLDQCFSYRYTQEELQPGMRVWVPFAHQRLVGFVDSLSEISGGGRTASLSDPGGAGSDRSRSASE